jgi:hypothetical protein
MKWCEAIKRQIQGDSTVTAEIINFKDKKKQQFSPDANRLNGLKIKFIDYFQTESIKKIHLAPVNLKCPYEKHLLEICALIRQPRSPQMTQDLAEYIFMSDPKGLTLQGFIDCINRDDLIMGCLQVELTKFSQLDKLFLVNVLKAKFPKEESVFSLMKTLLFVKDQGKLLETAHPQQLKT